MNEWFAEDGLMRLRPEDDREPLPGQSMRTVENENGIYFAGHHLLLRYLLGDSNVSSWADLFRGAALRLQSGTHRGIFYRHPGNTQRDEAHDNYVALAGCSALMGFEFARDIVDHGDGHFWCYNTLNPDKWSIRHFRQPGEWAFYRACVREEMSALSFVWLMAGVLINKYQARDSKHNNPSTSLLTFFRLAVLNEMKGWQLSESRKRHLVEIRDEWHDAIKRKYGSIAQVYRDYFTHPEHPLRALSKRYAEKWGH